MEIKTARLNLRELTEADCPAILAYQRNPLYLRYYEWEDRTAEQVRGFVAGLIERQHEQPRIKYQLAIELRSTGELIGNCGVRMDKADAREADVGYELAPQHWGNGYATEAARAMVDFGFGTLSVHRIWAQCMADNLGSQNVLRKLGMQQEGRLREKEYFKGRWWDALLWAVLESEYRGRTPGTAR